MARGYPDYFGYSVFPNFGQMIGVAIDEAIPGGGAVNDIVNIVGKGKTYSGFFYFNMGGNNGVGITVRAIIDGNLYGTNNLRFDYTSGFTETEHALLRLVYYNETSFVSSWAIGKDWTFGQSFIIRITSGAGAPGLVLGRFHYSVYQ